MSGTINANPTKEFFISMLVRDISLKDAIGDLVDNCVDGAKRLRGDNSYEGLEISISTMNNEFSITDNCGGIDLAVAEKYAFRFGRPDDMEKTDYSIGQFGIGMKRSLFKLGGSFEVKSKTINNSFSMSVDVGEWKESSNDWTFSFSESEIFKNPQSPESTGTTITVTDLKEDVQSAFSDPIFIQELISELELDHLYNLNKKLKIIFNDSPLKAKKINFTVSDDFKIGKWEKEYKGGVKVKLLVGIGSADEQLGGWYLFCNQRLIVGPDQSRLTGWTGRKGDGVANYHHQYWRFRGFAFFEAEDSSKLPWNTTKTGMNADSPIYKDVRAQMIEMMKSVINGFLNSLKKENESDYGGEKVLHKALDETKVLNVAINLEDIETSYSQDRSFSYPEPDRGKKKVDSGKTRITYMADKDKVKKMKSFFKVTTAPQVGSLSFDYTYENEIEE
ncbi:ATP-binding protein [Flagellimonas sp.]|uniref:ATP-binding protein n=1 Tax=Flagellimonas sp. TaxID=2058762 RepID=UPI003BAC5536